MKRKIIFITLIYMALVGCQSFPIVKPEIPSAANTATILIYREPAFNAGGGSLYFGDGEKTYASLSNKEYAEIIISAGHHTFHVTAQASKPFQFDVELKPDTSTCIKAYADPANYVKALTFPFLMNFTNIFRADMVSCPDEQFLKNCSKSD